MPNNYNELLIEAYKEQTASWKHENSLLHRFTSIILPLSIAVLGAPYVQSGGTNGVIALLAPMGGIMLMTFWGISCQIMETKSKIRHSIIYKLEETFGTIGLERFRGQDEFRRIRVKAGGKKLSAHTLRVWMFWIYFVVAIVVLLSKIIKISLVPLGISFVSDKPILAWTVIALFGLSLVLVLGITLKASFVRGRVENLNE